MKRRITRKLKSYSIEIAFKILDLFNTGKLQSFLYKYLLSRKKINLHITEVNAKGLLLKNYYSQHLPDRYSLNASLYNQSTNFLSFNDFNTWVKGNYQNNVLDLGRFFFLNLCIDFLLEEKIVGDVGELGVYKGNSAFLLSKYARRMNTKCYLFDTFEGFDSKDLVHLDFKKGQVDFSDTSEAEVKNLLGEQNIIYVKGYFPESLNQIKETDYFVLVHIDCDLEKPFTAALNYFYPRMKKGGFLIMHDHSSLFWPGAKKAIEGFFADKAEFVIPIPDKSGTCVIRKV